MNSHRKYVKPLLPKTISITPTVEEIELGICGSITHCMYAIAVKRMYPEATYIGMRPSTLTITYKNVTHAFNVPDKAVVNQLTHDIDKNKLEVSSVNFHIRESFEKRVRTDAEKEYERNKAARLRALPDHVRHEWSNARAKILELYGAKAYK